MFSNKAPSKGALSLKQINTPRPTFFQWKCLSFANARRRLATERLMGQLICTNRLNFLPRSKRSLHSLQVQENYRGLGRPMPAVAMVGARTPDPLREELAVGNAEQFEDPPLRSRPLQHQGAVERRRGLKERR